MRNRGGAVALCALFVVAVAMVSARAAEAHQDSSAPGSFVADFTVTLDRVSLLPAPELPPKTFNPILNTPPKSLWLLIHTFTKADGHDGQDAVFGLFKYIPKQDGQWKTISIHGPIYRHPDCTPYEPVEFEAHAALLPAAADKPGRHAHIPPSVDALLDEEGIVTDGNSATTPGTLDPTGRPASRVRKDIQGALALDGAFDLPDVLETFPAPGKYFPQADNRYVWVIYHVTYEYTVETAPCSAFKVTHRRAEKVEHRRATHHHKHCGHAQQCQYRIHHGTVAGTGPAVATIKPSSPACHDAAITIADDVSGAKVYVINWGDGTTDSLGLPLGQASSPTYSHRYTRSSDYRVVVEILSIHGSTTGPRGSIHPELSTVAAIGAVEVTVPPCAGITVSPSSTTITAGSSASFTATGHDQHNNPIGDVTSATTFTISPNGPGTGASCSAHSCTATRVGSYTVTGTDNAATQPTSPGVSLTVNPAALDHLALSPATAMIAAGGTQSYTATGYDQPSNATGDVTPFTTFAISPNGTGTEASCTGASCTADEAQTYTVTGTDNAATHPASPGVTLTVPASCSGTVKDVTPTQKQITFSCNFAIDTTIAIAPGNDPATMCVGGNPSGTMGSSCVYHFSPAKEPGAMVNIGGTWSTEFMGNMLMMQSGNSVTSVVANWMPS